MNAKISYPDQLRITNYELRIELRITSDCGRTAEATAEDFSVVQIEGNREVTRTVKHYNLDAIIAVGGVSKVREQVLKSSSRILDSQPHTPCPIPAKPSCFFVPSSCFFV
jgi:hypothetical protein